jgi:hypothetical protein
MAKKHLIKVRIENDICWLGDISVKDLKEKLSVIEVEQLAKGIFDLEIEEDYGYKHREFALVGSRNETEAEEKRRLKANEIARAKAKLVKQKNAERRDKSERTTYDRLKAKFERDQ